MGRTSHFEMDPGVFAERFDREPFAFSHNLSSLPAFDRDSLQALAIHYGEFPQDYFVSESAPAPNSDFFTVPHGGFTPYQAMQAMNSAAVRVLLKRPENHDARFRAILDELFAEVMALRGPLPGERLERLEGAIFITSASSITPFHFDPEVGFFSQIEGEKIYHVYPPSVISESELEDFYLRGEVSIGQIPLQGRDAKREHVIKLSRGRSLHQPQNAPHWVETRNDVSISYTMVFETNLTRAAGRTRAFNHYVRRAGINPDQLGFSPRVDAIKAGSMRALIPLRRQAGRVLRRIRPRAAQ